MYICIIVMIIFVLGLYFIFNVHNDKDSTKDSNNKEGYRNKNKRNKNSDCPNILVQQGNAYYLFNTKVARVPGVNPIRFDKLEDYTKFLKWQKGQNIICPVLYLRQGYDAQGEKMYSMHPSPTDMKAGRQNMILDPSTTSIMGLMDASRDDGNYNNNMYAGFDPQDQYVGVETPLDKIDDTKNGVSANPMKSNWGGQAYTQEKIDTGKYSGDEVYGYGDSAMD
jgi:hypothetical protein